MERVSVIIIDPTERFRRQARAHLGTRAPATETTDLESAERLAAEHDGPTVFVVGPGASKDALHHLEGIQKRTPTVSSVLVTPRLTTAFLHEAMRAGVRDVLPTSCTRDEFRDAIGRAGGFALQLASGRNGSSPEPKKGKIITVFSAKGGSGKSVLASNLGVVLSEREGEQVVLVDLDLESGDLAIMLRLSPTRTIHDVAQNIDRLDNEALRGHLTPYTSSLSLLAAPAEPGLAEKIEPATVRRILEMLRETHQHVIVDGPAFFTEHVLAALDESDECILIGSLDVPSVKNLKMGLRTLELLGFRRERIRLILNRADSKVGLGIDEVEKTLDTNIEVLIPSSRDVPLCVNRGVTVATGAPRSGVTASFRRLAASITGTDDTSQSKSITAPRSRFALIRR